MQSREEAIRLRTFWSKNILPTDIWPIGNFVRLCYQIKWATVFGKMCVGKLFFDQMVCHLITFPSKHYSRKEAVKVLMAGKINHPFLASVS